MVCFGEKKNMLKMIKPENNHCSPVPMSVRIGGLEPPLREELDPKSNAATNYAISAFLMNCHEIFHVNSMNFEGAKVVFFYNMAKKRFKPLLAGSSQKIKFADKLLSYSCIIMVRKIFVSKM